MQLLYSAPAPYRVRRAHLMAHAGAHVNSHFLGGAKLRLEYNTAKHVKKRAETSKLVRCRTSLGEPERIQVAQAGRQAACMRARRAVHYTVPSGTQRPHHYKAYIKLYAPCKGAI